MGVGAASAPGPDPEGSRGPPGAAPSSASAASGSAFAGLFRFLRTHPIVALALLTPGVVEYVSGSSSVLLLVEAPPAFFLFLAVNVGQYTGGALLIREAMLRWGKGWVTFGCLGLAYGITEEGLGDNTLFRGTHHADGVLGVYGHFLGVNWVWSVGVLSLHVIVSLAVPIVVLGLAIPETRGRSLIGPRGQLVCLLTVVGATVLESYSVWRLDDFWMGPVLFGASVGTVLLLLLAARLAPARWWAPTREEPVASPRSMFLAGFGYFSVALALEYGLSWARLPPALEIGIELAALAAILEWVRRSIGRRHHDHLLVRLAFGFVAWVAAFGVLLTLPFPYTLPLAAVAVYFFLRLGTRYPAPVPATHGGPGPAPA